MSAPMMLRGRRMYTVHRVRSTQKLPIVPGPFPSPLRVSPRASATAIASPAAAEMKLCQARPAIWLK